MFWQSQGPLAVPANISSTRMWWPEDHHHRTIAERQNHHKTIAERQNHHHKTTIRMWWPEDHHHHHLTTTTEPPQPQNNHQKPPQELMWWPEDHHHRTISATFSGKGGHHWHGCTMAVYLSSLSCNQRVACELLTDSISNSKTVK